MRSSCGLPTSLSKPDEVVNITDSEHLTPLGPFLRPDFHLDEIFGSVREVVEDAIERCD